MEAERFIGPILGAIVGWLLAQATTSSREAIKGRKVARAILQELEDIRHDLRGVMGTYQRLVALDAHGRLEPTSPRPISNFIFASHYEDAALRFTQAQRLQLQSIHNFVYEINQNSDELKKFVVEVARKHVEGEQTKISILASYKQMLEQHMHIIFDATWHVLHYLANPKDPTIVPGGSIDAARRKTLEGIQTWIDEQRNAAAGKPLSEVTRIYNPPDFQWPHLRETEPSP